MKANLIYAFFLTCVSTTALAGEASSVAGRFGLELGASLYGIIPQADVGASFAFTDQDVLSVTMGGGALVTSGSQLSFDDFEATRYSILTSHVHVNYSRTVWESLYLRGGLGYRANALSLHAKAKSDKSEKEIGGTSESYLLSAGIGNEWRWNSGLYLDVQWIGAGVALGKRTSKSLNGAESVPNVDQLSDFMSTRTALLARGEFVFATLSLGYRF